MDQRSGHAEEAERSGVGGRSRVRSRGAAGASLRAGAGRREVALRRSGDIVSMSPLERSPEEGAAGAARKRWTQKSS